MEREAEDFDGLGRKSDCENDVDNSTRPADLRVTTAPFFFSGRKEGV